MRIVFVLLLSLLSVNQIATQFGIATTSAGQALAFGALGLAAAAAAGAGLGGLLALLTPQGGGNTQPQQSYGYGGGYGGGGGGGGHGHGRKRTGYGQRSKQARSGYPQQGSNKSTVSVFRRGKREIHNPDNEQFFKMIADIDKQDCGKRYICELKVSQDYLNFDERVLLNTIQNSEDEGEARGVYKDAAYYGDFVKSMSSCASRFNRCQLRTSVRAFVQATKQQYL